MLHAGANQFAIELFHCYLKRHGDKNRNLLLCPYLIYHSLAMMLVGAKGQTAEQLMRVLRIAPTTRGSQKVDSSQRDCSSSRCKQANSASAKDQESNKSKQQLTTLTRSPSSASQSSIGTATTDSSLASPIASPVSQRRSVRRHKVGACGRGKEPKSRRDKSVSAKQTVEKSLGSKRRLTGDPDEIRHRDFLMLTEQLLHGNHDFVHLASFIYLDKSTKRTERFKAILRDYYETKPKKIEFEDTDKLIRTINEDVRGTTENIYNDILPKEEAVKLSKSFMLLVNAVFFRGFWLSNFTDVKQEPFLKSIVNSNNNKQTTREAQYTVRMMSKLDYLPIVEDQQLDARVIRMPFEASDLQMLLILPNNKQSDSTYLCDQISANKVAQIQDLLVKSKCRTVRVSMPIFCVDSGKISLQSTLVKMGASDLFDKSKADMSGVCENKSVWLDKILHRCFIICDNRGAITSSAFEKAKKRQSKLKSGISSGRKGVDEFRADHPFMYIILDSVTQTILLIGLYTDPAETLEVIQENQLSPEEAHQIYTEGVYRT